MHLVFRSGVAIRSLSDRRGHRAAFMSTRPSKQIGADYFQQRFPNDGQRFVAWYLRNILFRDMNETRDDITDGADDKQIDAVVIDDEKSLVHIVQGKFIQSGVVDAEPLREVLSSWIQIKDLARLQNVSNVKLQRRLSE